MNLWLKCKKALNVFHTKVAAVLYQSTHVLNGATVKYMLYQNPKSHVLVVSYPACHINGARYNYMRTLKEFNCNKLFLLDDYGENHQGCYLVEANVEKCVTDLLRTIVSDLNISNIIMIGSSKGGYSAIYYSFMIPNSVAVIGAPQYFIGSYLNRKDTYTNLQAIIGKNVSTDKIEKLDNKLRHKIHNSCIRPREIYIHYSDAEPTYDKHVKWLMDDLQKENIVINPEVMHYDSHILLGTYFPPFLKKSLKQILFER